MSIADVFDSIAESVLFFEPFTSQEDIDRAFTVKGGVKGQIRNVGNPEKPSRDTPSVGDLTRTKGQDEGFVGEAANSEPVGRAEKFINRFRRTGWPVPWDRSALMDHVRKLYRAGYIGEDLFNQIKFHGVEGFIGLITEATGGLFEDSTKAGMDSGDFLNRIAKNGPFKVAAPIIYTPEEEVQKGLRTAYSAYTGRSGTQAERERLAQQYRAVESRQSETYAPPDVGSFAESKIINTPEAQAYHLATTILSALSRI